TETLVHTLDFPLQLDARMRLYTATDFLAQRLDVRGCSLAQIEQEVAMLFRDLGVADGEAAAAGLVDQLPGFGTGRILEGRAAGAAAQGLARLPLLCDAVHLG